MLLSSSWQVLKICNITGGSKPTEAELLAMHCATPFAKSLLDALPSPEPTRLGKLLPRAPPEGIELCKQLLLLDPSSRLTAAAALQHPYIANGFTKDDASRARYAEASVAEAESVFTPPCDDTVRLGAQAYRALLEATPSLATVLDEPALPPPPYQAPAAATEEEMEDMGA